MRREFFEAIAIGLVLGSSLGHAAEARKPNIVLLVADDLGYADLGFTGARDIPTPNLDGLAAGGVTLTNGYVSGPYCSPTRAGLLTGRYQQRFGHEWNPGGQAETGLPLGETTVADRLKAAGYATGLVGKWHLGSTPRFHPQKRGFDEFFGFLGGEHTYFAGESRDIYRGTEVVRESEYFTDAISRESVAFIDRHKEHPFILEVAFNAVHTPLDATDGRLDRFASIADPTRRKYAAMLVALDEAIGAVLTKLRAAGLEEDTLVAFFSDNGGPTMLGTTINGSRNDPFRGSKRTTLEGGIHVPFLLNWKGKLSPGVTYAKPVIQLDLLPTALAAAGVSIPSEAGLDGVDLLPYLTGSKDGDPHESLYWRLGQQAAIRRGTWKLVRYDSTVDTPGARSVPQNFPAVTAFRLYDLASDPGESHDLSGEWPKKASELKAAWEEWDRQLIPPLWGPGVPPATPKP